MDAIKNLAVVELDATELAMLVGGDGQGPNISTTATCCSGGATIVLSSTATVKTAK